MLTFRNHFHGTTVRVRVAPFERLSRSQYLRARRKLCGMPTCHCGTWRDAVDDNGTEYHVVEAADPRDWLPTVMAVDETY